MLNNVFRNIGTTMIVFGISIINLVCQVVISCYSKKRRINIKPPTKIIMAKKKRRSLDTGKDNPIGSTTKKTAKNMEIQEGFFDDSGSRSNKTNSQRKFVGFLILLQSILSAQCPAGTDTSMKIKSYSFSYSLFVNVDIIGAG